jgi:hypothetical protein
MDASPVHLCADLPSSFGLTSRAEKCSVVRRSYWHSEAEVAVISFERSSQYLSVAACYSDYLLATNQPVCVALLCLLSLQSANRSGPYQRQTPYQIVYETFKTSVPDHCVRE